MQRSLLQAVLSVSRVAELLDWLQSSFADGDLVKWDATQSKFVGGTPAVPVVELTTVAGTSGSAIFSQPEQGDHYKKVVICCLSLVGSASYEFPVPFTHLPGVVLTDNLALGCVETLTTDGITITNPANGVIVLEGF